MSSVAVSLQEDWDKVDKWLVAYDLRQPNGSMGFVNKQTALGQTTTVLDLGVDTIIQTAVHNAPQVARRTIQ